MPKQRDPNRERAEKMWLASDGQLNLIDIAKELDLPAGTVRGWKAKDKWDNKMNGALQKKERNAPKKAERSRKSGAQPGNQFAKGYGAPKGNQNAAGNRGGDGGPAKNDKAVTHGFFRKFLPDDEETRAIYDAVDEISPLDLLWEQIKIKATAIVRAQPIMFVKDQDDETKVLKKLSVGKISESEEWEIQHAWDKQATFLNAQSRAMSTLATMIRQYEEMCRLSNADEEQHLRIQRLKAEIAKLKGDGDSDPKDDGFIEALKGKAAEVWDDDVDETET